MLASKKRLQFWIKILLVGVLVIPFNSLLFVQKQVFASTVFGQKVQSTESTIATGVTYKEENYQTSTLKQAVRVLEANLSIDGNKLALGMPSRINQLTKTSQLAIDNTREGHYVVGAVNASYFETNGFSLPANLVVVNNEILNFGRNSPDTTGPNFYNFAFGVASDGKPAMRGFNPNLSLNFNGKSYPIESINQMRENGKVALFTPRHRYPTVGENPSMFATEIVVTNASKDPATLSFGDTIKGTVSEITSLGEPANSTIPSGGFVISAVGQALADEFQSLEVGTEVSITVGIDSHWQDAEYMIATGPTLVRDGQVSISMDESSPFARDRHPRTAVAISQDRSKVFLVTVDGRVKDYSNGATLRELAQYLVSIGAYQAINLDGGGSTTMVVRLPGYEYPSVVNQLSDGRERGVSNSLQIISKDEPTIVEVGQFVIHSVESLDGWKSEAARSKVSHSLVQAPSPVRVGSKAVKLDYDFTVGEDGVKAAYLTATKPIQLQGKPLEIGAWVFGDGNEHWLRANVMDGQGQRQTINFTAEHQFNWTGWRYVRAEIPASLAGPISFERIYIAQGAKDKQKKGAIYIDQIDAIYDSTFSVERFTDVTAKHWAYKEIIALNDRNVITGNYDGSFKPDANITREQAAVMLVRQLGLRTDNRPNPNFKDVSESRPLYPYIAAAAEAGLITGRGDRQFAPNETLTRAEMASILTRAYKLSGKATVSFTDVPASHWAHSSVQTLVANGLTSGYEDGSFRPNRAITRAEFSTFLYRVKQ